MVDIGDFILEMKLYTLFQTQLKDCLVSILDIDYAWVFTEYRIKVFRKVYSCIQILNLFAVWSWTKLCEVIEVDIISVFDIEKPLIKDEFFFSLVFNLSPHIESFHHHFCIPDIFVYESP